jgi:hypothetical protein
MTDKPKQNNGNNIQKPNVPDQTRGQNPYSPPQKPVAPPPPIKPKK